VAKAVLDALPDIVFVDDRQVSKLTVSKRVAAGGVQPHTIVSIHEDPQPTEPTNGPRKVAN
jgi:Holliday junction resolvase RusA-like endonuclease